MKNLFLPSLVLSALALAFAGCSTPVVVVDPNGKQATSVVSSGIDPADMNRFAKALVESINASGVLNKYPDRMPVIGISTVFNKTNDRLDVNQLTSAIVTSLSDKARLMINRGLGPDGKPRYEDYQGAGKSQRDRFTNDAKSAPDPDFTLSGYISEESTSDKKTKLNVYTVHMRLTEGENVAWQGHEQIAKLQRK